MAALTSVKDFTANTVLTAADMDNVNCGVKVFASAATRDAAYGGSGERTLEEGEMCYLNDSNQVQYYDGSAWQRVGQAGNAAASTASGSYTGTVHEGGTIFDLWTFNASGSLVVTTAGLADILIVGGGGGGGLNNGAPNTNNSGGGGGGGYLTNTGAYLPAGTLTVVVGAGGAGTAPTANVPGNPGETSRLGSYYAVGGGPGRDYGLNSTSGIARGGSGGGGGGGVSAPSGTQPGGTAVSGQGNNGGTGTGFNPTQGSGGGGGGAGAVGSNASGTTGGAGGAGSASTITGSSVTRAGGGGGNGGTAGAGGTGGGGGGGTTGAGTNGGANTGGGGGGGNPGGSGGSGTVIVCVAR